jgi:membrane carboxypeptidase/penicillin-binding protein
VTVAWFGYDSYKTLGRGQMGGDLALPMWVRFMKPALKGIPQYRFKPPTGVKAKLVKSRSRKKSGEEYEYYPGTGAGQITDDSAKGSKHRSAKNRRAPPAKPAKSERSKSRSSGSRPSSSGGRSSGSSSGKSIESLF